MTKSPLIYSQDVTYLSHAVIRGCHIWGQSRSQMGHIRDFFRSDLKFKYILTHRFKMYWNLIWKSPGFVPFGANLTHFGLKSGHRTVVRLSNMMSYYDVNSLVNCRQCSKRMTSVHYSSVTCDCLVILKQHFTHLGLCEVRGAVDLTSHCSWRTLTFSHISAARRVISMCHCRLIGRGGRPVW